MINAMSALPPLKEDFGLAFLMELGSVSLALLESAAVENARKILFWAAISALFVRRDFTYFPQKMMEILINARTAKLLIYLSKTLRHLMAREYVCPAQMSLQIVANVPASHASSALLLTI